MPNNNPSRVLNRYWAQEKERQQELFEVFQQLDIFALSRLLVAANLPHFSRWLKQATILTVADTVPADTPNYHQALADKASEILGQKISVSVAKYTLFKHAGSFSQGKTNRQLKT